MPTKKKPQSIWLYNQSKWYKLAQKFPALIDKKLYESMLEEDIETLLTFSEIEDIQRNEESRKLETKYKR